MNARFYQPATGRFLSQDTYSGNAYEPWTQHLYTYCGNNPTNMVDPTGHFFNLIAGAIGAAVGAGISFVTYGFEKGWDNLAWDDGEMWKSIGVGAATGGLAGITCGASLLVQTAGNAGISAAGNFIEQGATKGFDNIDYTEVGISAGAGALTGGISYGVTKAVTKSVAKAIAKGTSNAGKGFDTFNEAKKFLGSPGEGNQWHHIVEQSQIGKSGFNPAEIQNTKNLIAIDKATHAKISGYYSSKQAFTGGKTVRDWLAGQSYQKQFDFGMQKLRDLGVIK